MNIQQLHERTAARFPRYWRSMARFRHDRESLGGWPEYCWVPMAAAFAVASGGRNDPQSLGAGAQYSAEIAALATWRATQGIYRFDPALWVALADTAPGPLPATLLHHLPEWCIALDLRDAAPITWGLDPLDYALAWVEWDTHPPHRQELRLSLLGQQHVHNVPIHLGGTVEAGIAAMADEALRNLTATAGHDPDQADHILDTRIHAPDYARALTPIVNALVYLASDAPDITGRTPTDTPARTETLRRIKSAAGDEFDYGPKAPRHWTIGARIAAQLRAIPAAGSIHSPRGSVRVHIRRAHWHLFWTGKGRTIPRVRWIMPVLVGGTE